MMIPVWLLMTVLYVGYIIYLLWKPTQAFDIAPLIYAMGATIIYLMYWVITLAIK